MKKSFVVLEKMVSPCEFSEPKTVGNVDSYEEAYKIAYRMGKIAAETKNGKSYQIVAQP